MCVHCDIVMLVNGLAQTRTHNRSFIRIENADSKNDTETGETCIKFLRARHNIKMRSHRNIRNKNPKVHRSHRCCWRFHSKPNKIRQTSGRMKTTFYHEMINCNECKLGTHTYKLIIWCKHLIWHKKSSTHSPPSIYIFTPIQMIERERE